MHVVTVRPTAKEIAALDAVGALATGREVKSARRAFGGGRVRKHARASHVCKVGRGRGVWANCVNRTNHGDRRPAHPQYL